MPNKYHVEMFVLDLKSYLKSEMCIKDILNNKENGLSSVNEGERIRWQQSDKSKMVKYNDVSLKV